MFKNLTLYRIDPGQLKPVDVLNARLQLASFQPCAPTQVESWGWVPPRGPHGPHIEVLGAQALMSIRAEKRIVPPAVVTRALDAKLDAVEKETGRRPKGKRAKELRDEVLLELLPRAFTRLAHTQVWLDRQRGYVGIDSASTSVTDAAVTFVSHALDQVLLPLQTAWSAPACMTVWLTDREGPAGFSLDRECELKQPDGEKARVRYSHHSLEIDEINGHLLQGKTPTQVAMTFDGRVSFVLLDRPTLTVKSLKLLDVVFEGRNPPADEFDGNLALFSGEAQVLVDELVEAMGGVHVLA